MNIIKKFETYAYRNKEGMWFGFLAGAVIYLTKIFPYNLITKLGGYLGRTDALFYGTTTVGLMTIVGFIIDAVIKPKK